MAGFRKAKAEQAAIKMSMYGMPGSGKTFSALLFAEGLAQRAKKRYAVIDTERGSDFYALNVPERTAHPAPFDFDALYTRSLSEALAELKKLKPEEYAAIVVDSMSHLWDAAVAGYSGARQNGKIPFHAWDRIKKPYRDLTRFLIDSPYHVFILGRESTGFEEDDDGELRSTGAKMRAEKETQYEPHICLRMAPLKTEKKGRATKALKQQIIAAFAEKDRSGVLQGNLIEWPNYDNVIAPLTKLLAGRQGATPNEEEAARTDIEAAAQAERDRAAQSETLARTFKAQIELCANQGELTTVGKTITPNLKSQMSAIHLAEVRTAYIAKEQALKGQHQNAQEDEAA